MASPAAIVGRVSLQGADQLNAMLLQLGGPTARLVLRKALRAGAKPIRDAARSLAPRRTGALEKSIAVRAGASRRDGKIRVVVTTGKATFVGDQFYGGFQEFGWKSGKRGASGRITDKNRRLRSLAVGNARRPIPGEHFMQYGFEEAKEAAVTAVAESIKASFADVMNARGDGGGE